jgi:hypothetical protein
VGEVGHGGGWKKRVKPFFRSPTSQHAVTRPKFCFKIQRQGHIGRVILIHIPAKPPSLCPASDSDAVFVDELDAFEDAMQQGQKFRLRQTTRRSNALLVLEKLDKHILRTDKMGVGISSKNAPQTMIARDQL